MHMCILVLRLLGGVCVLGHLMCMICHRYTDGSLVITVVLNVGKINQVCSIGPIFFSALQC